MSSTDILQAARAALEFQSELAGDLLPNPLDAQASIASAPVSMPTPDSSQVPLVTDDEPYRRIEALIPEGHPVLSLDSLEAIGEWLAATPLVEIDETRTNAVPGVGNPEADLMVIGEAPGAEEDKRGEPFVGRAGQLLDKILAAIDFARDDVFITNIVKSRPPNNRDPKPEEVAAHIPVLYRQIALIRPRLILCVGKQAACALLDRQTSLASLRGSFHDFHGIPLLATYHPAALLRNPQWKHSTWEDVQRLRARYDELTGVAPLAEGSRS